MRNFYLVLLGFLVCATMRTHGESSTCLTVYKEGGAPAVFQSPKCPLWKLYKYESRPRTGRCQLAIHQGRRKSQEDRTLCVLDLRIPFPGPVGLREVAVDIMAVFDGHNGVQASEMASKLLLEYFMLHTYFLLDTTFLFLLKKSIGRLPDNEDHDLIFQALNRDDIRDWHASDWGRFKLTSSAIFGGSFHLEILKEALLRAIHDIDVTFSKEASRENLDSGSTANVILIADGQILVANVGDSKALLCSEEFQSLSEAKASLLRLYRQRRNNGAIPTIKYNDRFKLQASNGLAHFSAREMTRDHHPDRDDERSRVESAGGHVLEWGGVSRVNGQLAVSRAIGDVSFKSYGVISAPEVTDWQPLTSNDSYLVAASDGIFEKLSPQDVCDILWELHTHGTVESELAASCSYSLADCIVHTALEKGSLDNMAAVVVPLTLAVFSQTSLEEKLDTVGLFNRLTYGVRNFIDVESELEHVHPVAAKFDRLLVEKKHGTVGCFYLSENLNEDVDYTYWVQKVDQQDMHDLLQALPEAPDFSCGGPLNLYNYQNMCFHFGATVNGDNGKCSHPEGFAGFIGFLESIPFYNVGSEYGSAEHAMPDSRYILKKRFGRGAFGEVWLAFYWNCTEGNNTSTRKFSFNPIHFDSYDRNSQTNSSARDFDHGASGEDLFILKRIMLVALKSCHDRNITHRDIKPENMVICFEDQDSGRCLKGIPSGYKKYITKMRLIDFGSAMDVFTMKHLYGSVGPSRTEQTYEYTPPEALLNASWYQGPMQTILRYDMWSAGVVFLELILGSPDVFQISTLTRALLDRHLEGWNDVLKELAHKLRSLMELCILIPGSSSKIHRISGTKDGGSASPASWKCSEEYFSQQIKIRDPLKIGFPNVLALRLVRQLLVWDPVSHNDERFSVDEALQHPYFQSKPKR
ncbi:probable protein phosphatase 2C 51 isoform X5 [Actinidia eriantha]|uniref:probable protein phosphatase 2C 51 isoform X5 n=1 Tax=Actinidia eriantha TaxID=165200 RepID=UPI002584B3EC|nr:probable protein phosphatase 2C 51 isoform X5 [Actinidia eriantha]